MTDAIDDLDLLYLVWREDPVLIVESVRALRAALPPAWNGRFLIVSNGADRLTTRTALLAAESAFSKGDVSHLRLRKNVGFGRAIDIGVSQLSRSFVGVFNPDGTVSEDALVNLVGVLRADDRIACAQASIVEKGIERQPSTTPPGRVVDKDWVPGGAGLYRRAAFLEVGGFDPLYFLYSEDVDLGRRLRRASWRSCEVESAVFRHGGDSRIRPSRLERGRRRVYWCAFRDAVDYVERDRWVYLTKQVPFRIVKRLLWGVRPEDRLVERVAALLGAARFALLLPTLEHRRRRPWDRARYEEWVKAELPRLVDHDRDEPFP